MARILVIEDDEPTRRLFRQVLETAGHEVEEAMDGDEGFRLYRVRPADVVLTDILMSGGDGLTAIHEILRGFPDARIIAVSGGGNSRNLDLLPKAMEMGALRSFEKPFDVNELLTSIEEVLAGEG